MKWLALVALAVSVSCGDPYSSAPPAASPTAPTSVLDATPTSVRVVCEQTQLDGENYGPTIDSGSDYFQCQAAAIYADGAFLPLIKDVSWQWSNVQEAALETNASLFASIAHNAMDAVITASFQGVSGAITIHASSE